MRKIIDKSLELAQAVAEKTPTTLDDAFLSMVQGNEALKDWLADFLGRFMPFGGVSVMSLSDQDSLIVCLSTADKQAIGNVDLVKLWQLVQLILELYNQFKPKAEAA